MLAVRRVSPKVVRIPVLGAEWIWNLWSSGSIKVRDHDVYILCIQRNPTRSRILNNELLSIQIIKFSWKRSEKSVTVIKLMIVKRMSTNVIKLSEGEFAIV